MGILVGMSAGFIVYLISLGMGIKVYLGGVLFSSAAAAHYTTYYQHRNRNQRQRSHG